MSDCVCSDYTMTASQRQQLPALHWGDRQPCQLPPPTEEYRTKRNGEGKRRIKGAKMGILLTFLIRAWLKSCLPSRVSWSNLLTNENVFLSFFFPFILGKRLCITPFVSFDRFLVTIDDLWMVWKLIYLSVSYFSFSLSFPSLHLLVHSRHTALCLLTYNSFHISPHLTSYFSSLLSLSFFVMCSRQLSTVHVRVRRTVRQTHGNSENQSLREV